MAISLNTLSKWLNKRVELTSTTHYTGQKGVIISIDDSSDENAFFGYEIKIKLDIGNVVTAYKFEGLTLISSDVS